MATATLDAPAAGLEIPVGQFDIATHNGSITIHNPATGNHRTFRVRTITEGNLEGRRVVELLSGPENESDYQGFGFVGPVDGRVSVWRKFRGTDGRRSDWERFSAMLERPADFTRRGLEYLIEGRCRRCNRKLTRPDSIASGLGPTCAGRE